MKICIDPGHNGASEPGAVGPTGLKEADCTLAISKIAAEKLRQAGVSVIMTRDADKDISLTQRCRMANEAGVDSFVSIHINSATNPSATGTETYSFAVGTAGEKLAQAIQAGLVEAIRLPDRGIKTANYQVLRDTTMPAVLTEVCFICNPAEESLLRQESFLEKAAAGIAGGILRYYDVATPAAPPHIESRAAEQAPPSGARAAWQAAIQSRCGFDEPGGVWKVVDTHPFADDVYRKWAESYK